MVAGAPLYPQVPPMAAGAWYLHEADIETRPIYARFLATHLGIAGSAGSVVPTRRLFGLHEASGRLVAAFGLRAIADRGVAVESLAGVSSVGPWTLIPLLTDLLHGRGYDRIRFSDECQVAQPSLADAVNSAPLFAINPAPTVATPSGAPDPVAMNALEWRAVLSLGAVYALRMIGMFMILPVFALYAHGLSRPAEPWEIGLAIGVYGLTQALLQIPLGMASDRWGRKPVIVLGMLIFAAGSLVAGLSSTVEWIIVGRALQGAGAVSSAVAALLADSTRDSVRTTAMAILGAGMGLAFVLALVLGPIISGWIGVDGIFLATAFFALLSLPVVLFGVPTPGESREVEGRLLDAVADPRLQRLNIGIFLLHACMTALFTTAPMAIARTLQLPAEAHWKLYLPVLLLSLIPVFPLIRWAESGARAAPVFRAAVTVLTASLALAAVAYGQPLLLVLSLLLFFVGFNYLEGTLPSMISRMAPPRQKGAALGIYSSAQFLGAFAGGALGGLCVQRFGTAGGFSLAAGLALLWLVIVIRGGVATPPPREQEQA